MTNYVTLLGAEDVARAGSAMREAADTISCSMSYFEELLGRFATRLDEAVGRLNEGGTVETTETKAFEAWGIIELFGHAKTAGRISEQTIGGETFIRVDVPLKEPDKFATNLYGKGAIYAIKLTDVATRARARARLYLRPPGALHRGRRDAVCLPRRAYL